MTLIESETVRELRGLYTHSGQQVWASSEWVPCGPEPELSAILFILRAVEWTAAHFKLPAGAACGDL